jgi:hypothetical protein
MARTKISEFSATPASNTDIDSIFIGEGMAPSNVNDAIRELMSQLKDWQSGTSNDPYVVGSSGSLTLNQGTANGVPYLNGSKVVTSGSALTFDGTNLNTTGNFQIGGTKMLSKITGDSYIWNNTSALNFVSSDGNTVQMKLDASGNFMVGATSALGRATIVQGASSNTDTLVLKSPNSGGAGSQPGIQFLRDTNAVLAKVFADTNTGALITDVNGAERARIDSSGNLLVGTTTAGGRLSVNNSSSDGVGITTSGAFWSQSISHSNASTQYFMEFRYGATRIGQITGNNTNTSYTTSSDYRLKNTIAPMTGALAKVAQLKPCTYKWNVDGSNGEGFIAHELAQVVPNAVTGEKDAVDKDGKPVYQGIDTSFLVATLTAAIQEQQAIIESLKARLDAANL